MIGKTNNRFIEVVIILIVIVTGGVRIIVSGGGVYGFHLSETFPAVHLSPTSSAPPSCFHSSPLPSSSFSLPAAASLGSSSLSSSLSSLLFVKQKLFQTTLLSVPKNQSRRSRTKASRLFLTFINDDGCNSGRVRGIISHKKSMETKKCTTPSPSVPLESLPPPPPFPLSSYRHRRRTLLGRIATAVIISAGTVFLKSPFSSYSSRAAAVIDVSGLRVEGQPDSPFSSSSQSNKNNNNNNNIVLAGVVYTPAAMMLQIAEQTASMEGMMKVSASEATTLTRAQRIEKGVKGLGPGVVQRSDLMQSVEIMVTNSQLRRIAPGAAVTLTRGIGDVVKGVGGSSSSGGGGSALGGGGDLSAEEYLAVGRVYEAGREELRKEFEKLSENEQTEGRVIVRRLRAKDEEMYARQQQQQEQ